MQRPGQGNALLIPERFEVLSRRSRFLLASQLRGIVAALWRAARGRGRPDHRQLGELRMFNEARLRDDRCGRVFTVFNTHLSADPTCGWCRPGSSSGGRTAPAATAR